MIGPTTYSVPALCRRWRIGKRKVWTLIESGELAAVDLRSPGTTRPLWRVTPQAVEEFERRRAAVPRVKVERRRRQKQDADYVKYY